MRFSSANKNMQKKFKMEECKPTSTPMNQKEKFCKEDGAEKVYEGLYRSMIGCLMYLTATRPDIIHVVSLLSRYMHCASEIHFQVAKCVIRYVSIFMDFLIVIGLVVLRIREVLQGIVLALVLVFFHGAQKSKK